MRDIRVVEDFRITSVVKIDRREPEPSEPHFPTEPAMERQKRIDHPVGNGRGHAPSPVPHDPPGGYGPIHEIERDDDGEGEGITFPMIDEEPDHVYA